MQTHETALAEVDANMQRISDVMREARDRAEGSLGRLEKRLLDIRAAISMANGVVRDGRPIDIRTNVGVGLIGDPIGACGHSNDQLDAAFSRVVQRHLNALLPEVIEELSRVEDEALDRLDSACRVYLARDDKA